MDKPFNSSSDLGNKIFKTLLIISIFGLIFQVGALAVGNTGTCITVRTMDGKIQKLCDNNKGILFNNPEKVQAIFLPPRVKVVICERNSTKCVTITKTTMNLKLKNTYVLWKVVKTS